MSRKIQRKQLDVDLSLGRTNSNSPSDYGTINISGLSNSDQLEDAFHKLELIIDKLAPETPPRLDNSAISLNATGFAANGFAGSGLIANGNASPSSVNNILKEAAQYSFTVQGRPSGQPSSNDGFVWNADSGDLNVVLDSNSNASVTFSNGSDTGSYVSSDLLLSLNIDDEKDYFAGVEGKQGFWTAFASSIDLDPAQASGSLDSGNTQHLIQLTHSETGKQLYQFYIEDNTLPVLSNLAGSVTMTEVVSGVATASVSDNINADFTITNAIKNFYRNDIVTVSGNSLQSVNYNVGSPAPTVNASITDSIVTNPQVNSYRNSSIIVDFTGRDVFNTTVNQSVNLTNKRIDTKSIFIKDRDNDTTAGRYLANSNTAVTSDGSGLSLNPYDHEISLKEPTDEYTKQLQLLNGLYRYPTSFNYSTYEYFDGISSNPSPNYSTGTSGSKRWVAFNYDLQTNKSLTQEVNIDILNNNGITTTNQQANNCNLYYKVITWSGAVGQTVLQETAWIEALGGVSATGFESGDPFMVGNNGNTETSVYNNPSNGVHIDSIVQNNRKLTVGNSIFNSGTNVSVHVRIGIASGQAYSFSGLNVSLS